MKKIIFTLITILTIFILVSCGECEHDWKEATCNSPKTCSLCSETSGTALDHSWADATCAAPKTCSLCKKTEGTTLEHNWINTECTKTPFCTTCAAHGETVQHTWVEASCTVAKHCSACGLTDGEELGHAWVQISCDQDRVCSVCAETTSEGIVHNMVFVKCTEPRYCQDCDLVESEAPGHDFSEATCLLPSRCTVCKIGKGLALGHDWIDATCTTPQSCTRCDATVGVVTGHTYTLAEVIAPTCSDGMDIYRCVCGDETVTYKPAILGYHICNEEGYCSVCKYTFDPSRMTLDDIFVNQTSFTVRCGSFSTPETRNSIYKPITAADLGVPIVELNGDLSQVSRNEITIPFVYSDGTINISCNIEIKIQGASSSGRPKKNYSIKLYNEDGSKNKVRICDDWGKEFKYCLKANWVDYSQMRNVVSAQLFGDMIRERDTEDMLSTLVNGGAIDGFPVAVFNNGVFHGLYTFNLPKDKLLFDMKDTDEKNQAIVMAGQWNDYVAMKKPIPLGQGNWMSATGWEVEHASNEESLIDNDITWIAESLNRLINFVLDTQNDDEAFINGVSQYVDIDKTIDSMLFLFFICADDNSSKNVIWVTYDGTVWFSSVYDMDGTWGLQWNGNVSFNENHMLISDLNFRGYNLLWQRLYETHFDKFVERYAEMRQGSLSYENIEKRFTDFNDSIPTILREAEKEKWSDVPSQANNNLAQILAYAKKRLAVYDTILRYNG